MLRRVGSGNTSATKSAACRPMLITSALLGQMKLTKPQAAKTAELFGLSKSEQSLLNEVPMRGAGLPMPPTDPLIYRFYELVMVNGPAWKALIEEEFGDGIMSAIDFDLQMERLPNPKGDRVKIGKIPAVQVLRQQRQHPGVRIQRGRRLLMRLPCFDRHRPPSGHRAPRWPDRTRIQGCRWCVSRVVADANRRSRNEP